MVVGAFRRGVVRTHKDSAPARLVTPSMPNLPRPGPSFPVSSNDSCLKVQVHFPLCHTVRSPILTEAPSPVPDASPKSLSKNDKKKKVSLSKNNEKKKSPQGIPQEIAWSKPKKNGGLAGWFSEVKDSIASKNACKKSLEEMPLDDKNSDTVLNDDVFV